MSSKIGTALTGASGIVSIELVDKASSFNPDLITDSASLIVQIVLAIATLVGLFKKKKPQV